MRNRLLNLVCLLLLGSAPAWGLELSVTGFDNPPDLVCTPKPTPRTPAPAARSDDESEPPGIDEIEALFASPPARQIGHLKLNLRPHGDPLVIGLWGDSHAAANFFTEEMIAALGLNKQQTRPTLIPPTMGRGGVRLPLRKFCQSPEWSYALAYTAKSEALSFSSALANRVNTTAGAELAIDFRLADGKPALTALTVLFNEIRSDDVVVDVEVDGVAYNGIALPRGETQLTLRAETPFSIVRLRVAAGTLALEGFAPVYAAKPALYFDTFGIPGATARGWRIVDPEYLKRRSVPRDYDVVMLEYGTNEGADRNFDAAAYREGLRASLRNLRTAFPSAQCVLIGPTDRGVRVKPSRPNRKTAGQASNRNQAVKGSRPTRGGDRRHPGGQATRSAHDPRRKASRGSATGRVDLLKYATVHAQIAALQNSVAGEFGCQFWDWQDAMGGPGSAYRWFYQTPRLMSPDLIHPTVAGYQRSARALIDDLGLKDLFK